MLAQFYSRFQVKVFFYFCFIYNLDSLPQKVWLDIKFKFCVIDEEIDISNLQVFKAKHDKKITKIRNNLLFSISKAG